MTNVLPDATKNALLNSAVSGGLITSGTHLAAFTGFPPAIGGNEITGGSPAYARKAITHTATAAAGAISPSSGLPATFDIPAGTTVRALAVCSALTAGSIIAWSPAGAGPRLSINTGDATDITNNDILSEAHGLVAGNSVLFWDDFNSGLPNGLAEDTEYFVLATGLTTDAFRVSTTLGGTVVDITGAGVGTVQKFVPEVYGGQGTYQATNYTTSLPG
jgi:hypothetical protein